MMKLNCWQAKKCGRESGGPRAGEMGVCPAATETVLDGVNGGINGGRACWVVAGTFCGGVAQGSHVTKQSNCMECDFYRQVAAEEGPDYVGVTEILAKLAESSHLQ